MVVSTCFNPSQNDVDWKSNWTSNLNDPGRSETSLHMSAPACSKVETRPTEFQTLSSEQQEWYGGSHLYYGMLQRFLSLVFRNVQLQTTVVALHLRCSITPVSARLYKKKLISILSTAATVRCWVPQTEIPMPANGSTSQNWWPSRIIWPIFRMLEGDGSVAVFLGEWMDEGKQDAREMVKKISMTGCQSTRVYHWRMWYPERSRIVFTFPKGDSQRHIDPQMEQNIVRFLRWYDY